MDSNFESGIRLNGVDLPPVDRLDRSRSPMRTPVHARLGSGFNPDPTRCRALVANPTLSPEDARRRCTFEVAFGARHSSSARVARDLHNVRCALSVLAIRPRTRQLTMFMTMLGARVHLRMLRPVAFRRCGMLIECHRPSPDASSRGRSRGAGVDRLLHRVFDPAIERSATSKLHAGPRASTSPCGSACAARSLESCGRSRPPAGR